MADEASFSISVQDGKVEVSGSEEFVREQIGEFKDVIKEAVKALGQQQPQTMPQAPQHQPTTTNPPAPPESGNAYPHVLALEEDGVKILKTLPGSNKSSKTRNAALLVLLGKKLMGEDTVPTSEIREVCKAHACLDSANFATHLKAGKEHFLLSGKGGSQTAKLSHPGEIKAKEIANELNSQ